MALTREGISLARSRNESFSGSVSTVKSKIEALQQALEGDAQFQKYVSETENGKRLYTSLQQLIETILGAAVLSGRISGSVASLCKRQETLNNN